MKSFKQFNENKVVVQEVLAKTTPVKAPSDSDLNLNDNFSVLPDNDTTVIDVTIATENIGQSGNIIITNPSSVTSLAFAELGAIFKTPSGATINFDLTADKIAVISYIVLTTSSILVNYIGDFS